MTTAAMMIPELRKVLKRLHYPLQVMLVCARWYAAYPLSFRHLEEMMQERGVFVDHSTVHRRAVKILPVMALIFRRRKLPVGTSWRMDETYIKVAGQWKYLYRAIKLHGLPDKITIDKSGANTAAIKSVNTDACLDIELRQSKYLNNLIEQDHRAVKRITDPMLGFKSFRSAQKLIAGIETMHMIKKGQSLCPTGQPMSAAHQFYSPAV